MDIPFTEICGELDPEVGDLHVGAIMPRMLAAVLIDTLKLQIRQKLA